MKLFPGVRKYQSGGSAFAGAVYTPSVKMPPMPRMAAQPTATAPTLDPDMFKGLEGYSVDVDQLYGDVQTLQNKLSELPPHDLAGVKGKRIMAQINSAVNPAAINRIKKSYELGVKANDELADNDGFGAFLTDSNGRVLVQNDTGVKWMNRSEAITSGGNILRGGDAMTARNNMLSGRDDIHAASRYTVGMSKVRGTLDSYLDKLGSDSKKNLSKSLGMVDFNGVKDALFGSTKTESSTTSNQGQVAQAIKAAWANLSQTERNTLLNESANDIQQGRVLADAEGMNLSDPDELNKLINAQAYQKVYNQLARAVGVSTSYGKEETFNKALQDHAGGSSKDSQVGNAQRAFMGVSEQKKIDISPGGKGKLTTVGAKWEGFGTDPATGAQKYTTFDQINMLPAAADMTKVYGGDGKRLAPTDLVYKPGADMVAAYLPIKGDGTPDYELAGRLETYKEKTTGMSEPEKARVRNQMGLPADVTAQKFWVTTGLYVDDQWSSMSDFSGNSAYKKYDSSQPGYEFLNTFIQENLDPTGKYGWGWGNDPNLFETTIAIPTSTEMGVRSAEGNDVLIPEGATRLQNMSEGQGGAGYAPNMIKINVDKLSNPTLGSEFKYTQNGG